MKLSAPVKRTIIRLITYSLSTLTMKVHAMSIILITTLDGAMTLYTITGNSPT
jgi:hypothetical protein